MATHPLDSRPETPISVLQVLDRTLGDKDRTANANALLCAAAKAISRVMLSIGLVLLALIQAAGLDSAIGSVVVVGGTGLVWGAGFLWKRFSRQSVGP
jgi:hypothetical protein